MMQYEQQLKLQAYLDGELSGAEARQVADWMARDQDAVALAAELRQTSQALKGVEEGIKLAESREFYWSKIQKAIDRGEARLRDPAQAIPWLVWLRRLLVPAAGVAVVAVFALVGLRNAATYQTSSSVTFTEDAQAFTYHDFSAGTTLVWLSFPADKRIAGEDELTIIE